MSSDLSSLGPPEQLNTGVDSLPGKQPSRWREHPERTAWMVLLISFLIFLVLSVTAPLAVRYAIRYTMVRHEARLEPTLGTLLFYASPNADPVAVSNVREGISEGSRIVADEDSTQGTLAFVGSDEESVLGSVQIYAGTALDIVRIRRPLFAGSTEPYRMHLQLEKGQARIFSNSPDGRPLHVSVDTPHGLIALNAGSYQVSVNSAQTDVTVRSGQAQLEQQPDGDRIIVRPGLRAWMTVDELAQEPVPAEQNLLANGDFSEPMLNTWQSYVVAENVVPGSVRIVEREGRWVAHFIRQGEENVSTQVGITQAIEKGVNVYDSLRLQLDVKLLHQSLSGAGYLSSEYPLRVEITYTDIYGKVLTWGHGFYYRDPENENWKIVNGEKIPPFIWYTYRSPNLMELLSDTRPARINSVRIYASGWNYQSMVSEAYLIAE